MTKQITIGIDGNEANIERRVGVNAYAFDLLCSIYKLQDTWKAEFKFVIYLKNPPMADLPQETATWKYKVLPGRGLWILTRLTPHLVLSALTRRGPNIFFTPSHYLPPFIPQPQIASIMDLGYLKFKGQFTKKDFWQLTLWSAYSIFASTKLIAISQSTKEDIAKHYPFAKNKTQVTELSYNRNLPMSVSSRDIDEVKAKYKIPKNYILFLSTLKPSKNIEGLVEAWGRIVNKYPEFSLVIGGKKGWLFESIFAKAQALDLSDKIIFTDFVSEEEKYPLLAGAKIFVLPSFWEGFGIDVLNAMRLGVPVVVSNVGSLPEVVQDAGVLVDPYSIDSIATGISQVLDTSKTEYNKLSENSILQAKKFSWEKTALKTLDVFREINK